MSKPLLRPLTPREQRVAEVAGRVFPVKAVVPAVAAILGVVAHGLVTGYCHPGYDGPAGGAALSYCSAADHGWSWPAFVGAALMIGAVPLVLFGHWRFRRWAALGLVVVAVVANTVIVHSLPGYLGP